MRIWKLIPVLVIAISPVFQSCKKSDPAPDPTPVPTVKPDTLSAGWKKLTVPGTGNIEDIFFNNATNGYATSENGIYKTADGGNAWTKLGLSFTRGNNSYVTPDNKAFFIGFANYSVYKTTDGGSTFINPLLNSGPLDIFFIDNNSGFCIAFDGLYKTVDAGTSWQKIIASGLPSGSYSSLFFLNSTTGWVVSQTGIAKSDATLTNWQPCVINGGASNQFCSVYAVSASVIYAANYSGEIFKSTDGGVSFSFIKKLEDASFTDIHFYTDQVGWASSGRSIYATTNGGATWNKVVSLGEGKITEIHFITDRYGWACGQDGLILTFL